MQELFSTAGFEVIGQLCARIPKIVVSFRKDCGDVRQKQWSTVRGFRYIRLSAGAPLATDCHLTLPLCGRRDDALPLLLAHGVSRHADEFALMANILHRVRRFWGVRAIIDPDGTNAVPGDVFPAYVDNLFFGHPRLLFFLRITSAAERAW